jgi:hypothetical protein
MSDVAIIGCLLAVIGLSLVLCCCALSGRASDDEERDFAETMMRREALWQAQCATRKAER